jgi:hypothetical protein
MAFSAVTLFVRRRAIPIARCREGQRRETRGPQPCVRVSRINREINRLGAAWAHSLHWPKVVMNRRSFDYWQLLDWIRFDCVSLGAIRKRRSGAIRKLENDLK